MPKKPAPIAEGDHVQLHAKVTRVDGERITVKIDGYAVPVTLGLEWVEVVEKFKEPKVRDIGL